MVMPYVYLHPSRRPSRQVEREIHELIEIRAAPHRTREHRPAGPQSEANERLVDHRVYQVLTVRRWIEIQLELWRPELRETDGQARRECSQRLVGYEQIANSLEAVEVEIEVAGQRSQECQRGCAVGLQRRRAPERLDEHPQLGGGAQAQRELEGCSIVSDRRRPARSVTDERIPPRR